MKKIIAIVFICIAFAISFSFTTTPVYSDELDELNRKISELQTALEASKKATTPLESQATSIKNQLGGIESQIRTIEQDIESKKDYIAKGYSDLGSQKEVFDKTVREFYMKNALFSPLLVFISSADASQITRLLAYQQKDANQDKALITSIALKITDLEQAKRDLEHEESRLSVLKAKLAKDKAEIDKVVAGAKDYQQSLSGEIAALSAKQQEIINSRSGSFTFTLGSGELADEYLSSAKGFQESAPSGYFAVFSFGGYSHRNGMSQYGARGRAEAGQSVEEILKAYYPNATLKKDYSVMENITVEGHGSMPFEDQYLQGIYEIPSSWHVNALKAQAIAARTYAVRHTDNGQGSICTTESCQVFKNEKKGGAWEQAVNETKGWVLVDGSGKPVSTQYASTHGGFSRTSGWDTTDKSGGPGFLEKAYERLGNSPWLEKIWWREGYSVKGDTCGRSNPWLSPQEMADIVNAAIALKTPGIDTSRITPTTTSCWGGNPYSMDELRSLLGDKGISSATSVSISQGNGVTNSVTINGVSISGADFRTAFNLRAPGRLRIPQYPGTYGDPFFNVAKK